MKKESIFIIILTILLFPLTLVQAENDYMFKANPNKKFMEPEKYYYKIDPSVYHEYDNSNINYKGLVLYKDITKKIKKEAKKFYIINENDNSNPNVSPERKVYLYYTVKVIENNNRGLYKFIIIDAETGKTFAYGEGDRLYSDPRDP